MIVKVSKVRLLTPRANKDTLLRALQKENKFMLFNYESEPTLLSDDQNNLKRIEKGIEVLSKHEKKKFFAYHEVEENALMGANKEAETLLEEVLNLARLIEEKNEENIKLSDDLALFNPYQNLSVATSVLDVLERTKIMLGFLALQNVDDFVRQAEKLGFVFEESSRDDTHVYGAFVYEFVHENEAFKLVNAYHFETVILPRYEEKLSNIIPFLVQKQNDNKTFIKESEETLKALSVKANVLRVYYDALYNESLRRIVKFSKTEKVAYLEGWVVSDEVDKLRTTLNEVVECEIEELPLVNEELTPTATKNNKFVRQFETITNMFSVPHPDEFDPNPIMSIWYWIIFGIMMGDIGYGALMIIFFVLFLKLKKPKGELKMLAYIFAYSGIPAIIFGVLTGSVFGFSVDLLKIVGNWFGNPSLSSVVLQPVDDPMTMLFFSLGLGIAHIITGLVIKLVSDLKKKDILGALSDALSWILILVGLIIGVLVKPMLVGIIIAGVGALLILLLNGRKAKNIVGKALGGLGGLYNVTGYLSDVLSYSRILALSLSTAVIAFTMNLLAGMVSENKTIIGIFFAIIIYIVGHVFNFVMGLLSAYVHDGRLQYLEFFGKFYEGGGYQFSPFSYKLKYIDEIKEN